MQRRSVGRSAHLPGMSNHTIAAPITTWAELRATDREVLNRAEVAALLTLDPRTVDHAIDDGTIPAVGVGRRVLIPRRPFLETFGVDDGGRSRGPALDDATSI
jgi:excisionase family DNA binding protein